MNIIQTQFHWNGTLKQRNVTEFLVLHHAKTSKCTIHHIHEWHIDNGWIGVGYHFFIDKTGKVFEGRPITIEGAHAQGYNQNSLGVCFEGDFNQEAMTDEQIISGIDLIQYCRKLYPGIRVVRHSDVNSTDCPGANFRTNIIYAGMKEVPENLDHWAEKPFAKLIARGIEIHEKRFDDKITRGEVFALLSQIVK